MDEDEEYNPDLYKVVRRARDIPDGATVTKKTGTAEYIIKHSITIYNEGGAKQVIEADDAFYLVNDRGQINAMGGSKELLWHVDINDLYHHLDDILQGPQQ